MLYGFWVYLICELKHVNYLFVAGKGFQRDVAFPIYCFSNFNMLLRGEGGFIYIACWFHFVLLFHFLFYYICFVLVKLFNPWVYHWNCWIS